MRVPPGHSGPPAHAPAPGAPGDRKLTTAGAAMVAGVKPATWRAWQSQGRPRPEPAPGPNGWYELRTPWWWASTVAAWTERRRTLITTALTALAAGDPLDTVAEQAGVDLPTVRQWRRMASTPAG